MNSQNKIRSVNNLSREQLKGKLIFIRVDFNVPMVAPSQGHYRVADDTRIRRFLDMTFKKIHTLTDGDCKIIIGSHLGRPHIRKDHSGWDGIFNIQFVSSHFDTLIRQRYGDAYTIFPPEIVGSQLKHSLELIREHQLPIGGIKFLPNLRYLLDPENPEIYRQEFIEILAAVSDVYINCAFGTSHRLTKSIKLLPEIMRKQGKLAVGGGLLIEEISQLGKLGRKILKHPEKTLVVTGGAKISDKIGILKQFVNSQIGRIFVGGKMTNAFSIARSLEKTNESLSFAHIPQKLLSANETENQMFLKEIKLAREINDLADKNDIVIQLPMDFKIVKEYQQTTYKIKKIFDLNEELQLDLGPETIQSFSNLVLKDGIENIFWNGPLGAYDHPHCSAYAEGSMELAKLLFCSSMVNPNLSVVIGGGDTAAILNKFKNEELKDLLRDNIQKQLPSSINRSLLEIDFKYGDSYTLFNNFASNFFVSTGGGASLEFMEGFLKDQGKSSLASYLPGTTTLLEDDRKINSQVALKA